MILQDIRKETTSSGTEISAEAVFESLPGYRKRVWFRTGPENAVTDSPGNPLFAGFLIPAMALGENLLIEAPVSAPLIRAATQRVQPVFLRWFPEFRAPEIRTAGEIEVQPAQSRGVACSFSGGLDSWYTFLKNRQKITHFLYCRGFDRAHANTSQDYFVRMSRMVRNRAAQFGKEALELESNLTEVGSTGVIVMRSRRGLRVDPAFQTNAYFTSQLIAYALFFSPEIGTFFIANSYPYEIIARTASNPLTDPAWSTPELQIRHDGAELDRTGKLEFIFQRHAEAIEQLHVCHAFGSAVENCNRCEKCLRTRTSLHLAGLLDRSSSFESPLRPDEIRAVYFSPPSRVLWEHLLETARLRGDEAIARAIEAGLGSRFDRRRTREDLITWVKLLRTRQGRRKVRKRLRRGFRQWREQMLRSI